MSEIANERPFTEALWDLRTRKGLRYADLESGSDRARSTAWYNKLLNGDDPWVVSPPDRSILRPLARLLETTPRRVAEMIADEWYGVKILEESARVGALTSRIEALDDRDYDLVEALIQRLQPS